MSSEYIGEDEQTADLVRRYVERNTVSGAGERRCGAWYQAGGCILSKRHTGQHRNQAQMETDQLREMNATLSDRLAASEARVREMEGAARALVGKSPFFISIGTPDWYCCQFCLRTETTEGLHGDGCEFAALDAALRGAEGIGEGDEA